MGRHVPPHVNIIDFDTVIPDEEGVEFADDDAALQEARKAALDMLRDAVVAGDDILHQIIEISTDGRLVGRLSLASVALPLS